MRGVLSEAARREALSMSAEDRSLQDLLEELVADCLERLPEEGPAAVDRLCAAHPEHAEVLRRMVDSLARMGLLQAEADGEGATRGETLGPYRLLERLGAGGMGEVYLAEQQDPARRVALKLLRPGQLLSQRARARFRREIDAIAQLHHPAICPLLDGGEIDGTPFLAMRYVEGRTLAAWIEGERAAGAGDTRRSGRSGSPGGGGVDQVLVWIERIAAALHYAHENGVVHRDVKPGNVLITPEGDPVLLDFGLARQDDDAGDGLTMSGDLLGTPAYMAPEQVAGHGGVDRRADVYGLAATLYEALTLQSPYVAPTLAELYSKILSADLTLPSARRSGLPRDLDVVLATALDADPDRRYRTAQAFAEDLRRVREHQPIVARPSGPWLRARRWARRRPALATAVMAAFLLLVTGLGLALFALDAVRREQEQTSAALDRARIEALVGASNSNLSIDTSLAFLLARAAWRLEDNVQTRSQMLAAMAAAQQLRFMDDHEATVLGVELAPDGSFLLSHSIDGTARTWSVDGEALQVFRHEGRVTGAVVVPGTPLRILTASRDGSARLWELDGRQAADPIRMPARIEAVTFDPSDPTVVAVGGNDGRVEVFRLEGTRFVPLLQTREHKGLVRHLRFTAGGKRLLSGSWDGTARLWSLETGDSVLLEGDGGRTEDIDVRRDDGTIAVGFGRGKIGLWDASGRFDRWLEGHGLSTNAVLFLDDGTLLSGSSDASVRHWDRDGRLINRIGDHAAHVRRIAVGAGGDFVVTASGDGRLRQFGADGQLRQVFSGHDGWLSGLVLLPDRGLAVTSSGDGRLGQFSLRGGAVPVLVHPNSRVEGVLASPDGRRIYTGDRDGKVRVWSTDGELQATLPIPGGFAAVLRDVCADGRLLVTVLSSIYVVDPSGVEEPLEIPLGWDVVEPRAGGPLVVASGDGRMRWVDPGGEQPDVAISSPQADRFLTLDASPDGRFLLGTYNDGTCKVWPVDGESEPAVLPHPRFLHATFATDDLVLTTCADGFARLWDWRQQVVVERHDLGQNAAPVAVSPGGGRWFCAGLKDGTAVVWERGGRRRCVLRAHRGQVLHVAFATEDRVVTAGRDGTARIWSLDDASLEQAAAAAPRDFTAQERALYRDLLGPEESRESR